MKLNIDLKPKHQYPGIKGIIITFNSLIIDFGKYVDQSIGVTEVKAVTLAGISHTQNNTGVEVILSF